MPIAPERMPLTLSAYRMLTAAGTALAPHLLEHRLRRGQENPDRPSLTSHGGKRTHQSTLAKS